jgi:hypothetical protein
MPVLAEMAQSFGNSFTIVEVTSDEPHKPVTKIWLAWAKPSQAIARVLAAVPEGWTAEVAAVLSAKHLFQQPNLKPGEIYKITPD